MPHASRRDPGSKGELVDRILSYAFEGDLRQLAGEGRAELARPKPHVIQLTFPHSGTTFQLVVRKPRQFSKRRPPKKVTAANDEPWNTQNSAPAASSVSTGKNQRRKPRAELLQ